MALLLRRDANHPDAVRLWSPGRAVLTTNHVVGETWTYLCRRGRHAPARLTVRARARGAGLLRRHDERVSSFVDATSFVVMRRERLGEALAFDGDFSAAGFVEVRP